MPYTKLSSSNVFSHTIVYKNVCVANRQNLLSTAQSVRHMELAVNVTDSIFEII